MNRISKIILQNTLTYLGQKMWKRCRRILVSADGVEIQIKIKQKFRNLKPICKLRSGYSSH